MGFYPVRRGWATGQAAIASAMGRASRLAPVGPPFPISRLNGVGRSGTATPRTRSEDGISAQLVPHGRDTSLALMLVTGPPRPIEPLPITGDAGDHLPRPNSGGHLPLAGEGLFTDVHMRYVRLYRYDYSNKISMISMTYERVVFLVYCVYCSLKRLYRVRYIV